MAKKHCSICGEELGLLFRVSTATEPICRSCWDQSGLQVDSMDQRGAKQFSATLIKKALQERFELDRQESYFEPSRKINPHLIFDDEHQLVKINGRIYRYSNLFDFEPLIDGTIVTTGGLSGAIIGGALYGDTGAILGGILGRKETPACKSMQFKVTLMGLVRQVEYIVFIGNVTKMDSSRYRRAVDLAEKAAAALQMAMDLASRHS